MNVTACWESWCADVTVSYALLIVFATSTSIWCLMPPQTIHEVLEPIAPTVPTVAPKPRALSTPKPIAPSPKRKPGRPKGSGTKNKIEVPVVAPVEPVVVATQ